MGGRISRIDGEFSRCLEEPERDKDTETKINLISLDAWLNLSFSNFINNHCLIIAKEHCSIGPVYRIKLNLEIPLFELPRKPFSFNPKALHNACDKTRNKDTGPTAAATKAQKLVALISAGIAKAKRANGPRKRTVWVRHRAK